MSWHGSPQIPTPNLDALAGAGMQLQNYYVQPVCSPTRSTLLSGRHVIHSGIYDPFSHGSVGALSRNYTLLPQYLQRLGFQTNMVGKWHLGMFNSSYVPTARGFGRFFGYYTGAEDYWTHFSGPGFDIHNGTVADWSPSCTAAQEQGCPDGTYSTHLFTRAAVGAIGDAARAHAVNGQPLFLYMAYQAMHSPTQAPARYVDRFDTTIPLQKRRTVAGMVAAMDEGIGNITAALKAHGLWNDTLLLFSTDVSERVLPASWPCVPAPFAYARPFARISSLLGQRTAALPTATATWPAISRCVGARPRCSRAECGGRHSCRALRCPRPRARRAVAMRCCMWQI